MEQQLVQYLAVPVVPAAVVYLAVMGVAVLPSAVEVVHYLVVVLDVVKVGDNIA